MGMGSLLWLMKSMGNSRGTYMLAVRVATQQHLEVGKLGATSFKPGVYVYVGSALGPGGLRARLSRYMAGTGSQHWHIDYLLSAADVLGAVVRGDGQRHECQWADWLRSRETECVRRFGSSDCRCKGHLFYLGASSSLNDLTRCAQRELGAVFMQPDVFAR